MLATARNKRDWIADNSGAARVGYRHSIEANRLHALNCAPRLLTDRLRRTVPLLEFVGAKFSVVSPERTVMTAPLAGTTSNQNMTQQASVFYILADYTLGFALFSAIPWVYMIDVHDKCASQPVQMWLLTGSVKHIAPGTGEITAVAGMSADDQSAAKNMFERKRRCRFKGEVRFYQDDRLIALAEHEVGMYAATVS